MTIENRKYRIVLDARGSQPGFKDHLHRGIGRFVFALAPRLPDLIPEAQFYWLFDGRFPRGDLRGLPGVQEIMTEASETRIELPEIMRNQYVLRRALMKFKPDLTVFFRDEDALLFWRGSVLFVYDLIHFRYPDLYRLRKGFKNKIRGRLIAKMTRDADLIITISENSRQDIEKFLQVGGDRISIVYAAIDHNVFFRRSDNEILSARRKFSLPEIYFLYVGGIDPRKNVKSLIRAFALVARKYHDISLVMAGASGGQDELAALNFLIDELELREKIMMPGYIPDDDLAAVYSASKALVLPSMHEGFGLPILEAMACSTPVVASKTSAIPEVAGDLAIYCDVGSIEDLALAMERALLDEEERKKMKIQGPLRAQMFNWDVVAVRVASNLRMLLEGRKTQ